MELLSSKDLSNTQHDLALWGTVAIVSNVVGSQLSGVKLFNEEWMHWTVGLLMGAAVYALLTVKLAKGVVNIANLGASNNGLALLDVAKFGTIFTVQKIVMSYLQSKPVFEFDIDWMKSTGFTIGGYVLYIMLKDNIPMVGQFPVLGTLIKVSMGNLLAHLAVDGTVTQAHLMELAALLAGFTAFDLIISRAVPNADTFGSVDYRPACNNAKNDDECYGDSPSVSSEKKTA